jgi:short-subunit dehydrogenase
VSLLLTARRAPQLDALAEEIRRQGGQAQWLAGDLTSAAFRAQLVAHTAATLGGLDLLVNNAGAGRWGSFESGSEAQLRDILELNFVAPVELTRLALPLLQRAPAGMIVNIGSVLGHCALPYKSEYCAAKFALHGWSDALRAELRREATRPLSDNSGAERGNVAVLLVSPSTTATEFFERTGEARRARAMAPAEVAWRTRRAMETGRQEIILSWGGKLLVWFDRLCPPLMNRLLARYAPRPRA